MLKRALPMSLPDVLPAEGRAKTAATVNLVADTPGRDIASKAGQCMKPPVTGAAKWRGFLSNRTAPSRFIAVNATAPAGAMLSRIYKMKNKEN